MAGDVSSHIAFSLARLWRIGPYLTDDDNSLVQLVQVNVRVTYENRRIAAKKSHILSLNALDFELFHRSKFYRCYDGA